MKAKFLFLTSLFTIMMGINAQAQHSTVQNPISWTVKGWDDSPITNGPARGPVAPPVVYQEDNTLTFVADHPEYVLYIKDEDEEVVYSAVVTSAETEVTLPSYLSGTYEIELVMGNWLFTGWIDL